MREEQKIDCSQKNIRASEKTIGLLGFNDNSGKIVHQSGVQTALGRKMMQHDTVPSLS